MNNLIENWPIIFLAIIFVAALAGDVYAFIKLAPSKQKEKVQEWLLWAVTEAEKELGGGTGQLKLRKVYQMFLTTFPWLAQVITFKEFSEMVDKALDKMRNMLDNNSKAQNYVDSTATTGLLDVVKAIQGLIKKDDEEESEDN